MKDEKHYEYLYTLDSFLKFERKIYQFAGLTFGRPIKLKFLLYTLVIFSTLLIWRFIPILNLPIKWVPIVILLVISGLGAWLLADIGTENRNPMKYFKSFIGYHRRRMKQVTYYRGKEIPKLKDYDMSGHTVFNLPSNPVEVNTYTFPHLNELEGNEPINIQDLAYTSQYKPVFSDVERINHQQLIAAHYESTISEKVLPIELIKQTSFNREVEKEKNTEELFEVVVVPGKEKEVLSDAQNKSDFEKREISSKVVELHNSSVQTFDLLPSLTESFERKTDELSVVKDITAIEPIHKTNNFEQAHFTPIVRKSEIETTEKINDIEEKIFYLKIGEINKLSSDDSDKALKDKQSIIEKLIEKTLEAMEKRKQIKRYKNRKKKG